MPFSRIAHPEKIINAELARIFLRKEEMHGAFKALVRLAVPENHPACMEIIGPHSTGLLKVKIPCELIAQAANDKNVLSIELREYMA